MTVLELAPMTLGSTVNAGGKLLSPPTNTFTLEHSVQATSGGAWIAILTSGRSK